MVTNGSARARGSAERDPGRARASGHGRCRRAPRRCSRAQPARVEQHRERILRRGGKRHPDAALGLQLADQPAALGGDQRAGAGVGQRLRRCRWWCARRRRRRARGMICSTVRPARGVALAPGRALAGGRSATRSIAESTRRVERIGPREAGASPARRCADYGDANHGGRLRFERRRTCNSSTSARRRRAPIAFAVDRRARSRRPGLVWLGGFKSDMDSTKARALDDYCARRGPRAACASTIPATASPAAASRTAPSRAGWRRALAVIRAARPPAPQILVGSSMGGWLALLAARALAQAGEARAPRRHGADRARPSISPRR